MTLHVSWLGRIFVLFLGLVIVQMKAGDSSDFWNYYDRFMDRDGIYIRSVIDALNFLWLSESFYVLMGVGFDVSPLLPYHLAWIILWSGLTVYGYRGFHWLLFLCFFPGPDLMTNLIRQETALGVLALSASLGSPILGTSAFLFHPSGLVAAAFLYLTRMLDELLGASPLRILILCSVAVLGGVWLLTSPFVGVGLAKLDAKRGLAEFGPRFIYFVYVEYALLAVLCLTIRARSQRLFYFATVVSCLFFTMVEIYFYRFLYVFYPFIIYEIGEALRHQMGTRKPLLDWLTTAARYGLVLLSGSFVLISLM
jgi:hypothetical protein